MKVNWVRHLTKKIEDIDRVNVFKVSEFWYIDLTFDYLCICRSKVFLQVFWYKLKLDKRGKKSFLGSIITVFVRYQLRSVENGHPQNFGKFQNASEAKLQFLLKGKWRLFFSIQKTWNSDLSLSLSKPRRTSKDVISSLPFAAQPSRQSRRDWTFFNKTRVVISHGFSSSLLDFLTSMHLRFKSLDTLCKASPRTKHFIF